MTIKSILLNLAFLMICLNSFAQDISYHCESEKSFNGKSSFENLEMDLTFNKPAPFQSFSLIQKQDGKAIFHMKADPNNLYIKSNNVVMKYNLKQYFADLKNLRKKISAYLNEEFQNKKLIFYLNFLIDPLTGQLNIKLKPKWETKKASELFYFRFIPEIRPIERKTSLPFNNFGYTSGEYFYQIEQETGMAANIQTSIGSAYLNNFLKCRKRLLKNKIEIPDISKEKTVNLDYFSYFEDIESNSLSSDYSNGLFLAPLIEIFLEAFAHAASDEKTKSILVKSLKDVSLDQKLKLALPKSVSKNSYDEFFFRQIQLYSQQNMPSIFKIAPTENLEVMLQQTIDLLKQVILP